MFIRNMKTKAMTKEKVKEFSTQDYFYLKKLDYLNENFDEQDLNQHYFPNNFRCASFSQSYSILNNPQYDQVDKALDRA